MQIQAGTQYIWVQIYDVEEVIIGQSVARTDIFMTIFLARAFQQKYDPTKNLRSWNQYCHHCHQRDVRDSEHEHKKTSSR